MEDHVAKKSNLTREHKPVSYAHTMLNISENEKWEKPYLIVFMWRISVAGDPRITAYNTNSNML